MSISLIFIILLGVIFTSFVSGILGMAGDALMLTLLSFTFLPIHDSALLYAASVFFACGGRAFIHRKHVRLKSIEYYMAGLLFVLIFGTLPGIALDKTTQDFLQGIGKLLLGIALLAPFLSRGKTHPDFHKPPQALLAAVLSNGFKSIDTHGFLLNLFFQDIPMTRQQVVSTKAIAQLVPAILFLVTAAHLVPSSEMSMGLPWICVAIAPAAFIGSLLSKRILDRLGDKQFYITTRIILAFMAVICLGDAILLLMRVIPAFVAVTQV